MVVSCDGCLRWHALWPVETWSRVTTILAGCPSIVIWLRISQTHPSGFITHVAASPCFRPTVARWMQHNHLPSDHGQWAMDKDSTQLPIVDPPRMGAVEPTLGGLLIDIRTLVLGSSPRHVHEPTVRLMALPAGSAGPPGDKEYTYRHIRKEWLWMVTITMTIIELPCGIVLLNYRDICFLKPF